MNWMHVFIPLYVIGVISSFLIKTLIQYQRSGINPYRFDKTDSPQQRFLQRYGNVISVAWLLVIGGYTWDAAFMAKAGLPLFSDSPALRIIAAGTALLFLSGLITAQWQMGSNWRVGIDEQNETELVTHGLFRHMRNPVFSMFLGCLASMAAFYPSVATLLLWFMSFSGLYLQILYEEAFLERRHGPGYKRYKTQAGRFLPRF